MITGPIADLAQLEPILVERVPLAIGKLRPSFTPSPEGGACAFAHDVLTYVAPAILSYRTDVIAHFGVPPSSVVFRRRHADMVHDLLEMKTGMDLGPWLKQNARLTLPLSQRLPDWNGDPEERHLPCGACGMWHLGIDLPTMVVLGVYARAWGETWREFAGIGYPF